MVCMNTTTPITTTPTTTTPTTTTPTTSTPTTSTAADDRAVQLSLLPSDTSARDVPARFRLSRETRERGLRHVAEIRRMLAERSEAPVTATAPAPRAA
jgi:hypothetical protein